MSLNQSKPSFRPTPIVFNSRREEEDFEKWAFDPKPNEQEMRTQKMLDEFRRKKKESEKLYKQRNKMR